MVKRKLKIIANATGYSYSMVTKVRAGTRTNYRIETLLELAEHDAVAFVKQIAREREMRDMLRKEEVRSKKE